jgi:hypothetical protein
MVIFSSPPFFLFFTIILLEREKIKWKARISREGICHM